MRGYGGSESKPRWEFGIGSKTLKHLNIKEIFSNSYRIVKIFS